MQSETNFFLHKEVEDAGRVEALRERDERAWKELDKSCRRGLFSQAMWLTHGDVVVSEDLVQSTMERAHRYIGTFSGDSALKTWLHRILRNLFLDHVRHESREKNSGGTVEYEDGPLHDVPQSRHFLEPEEMLLLKENQETITESMRRMPPKHREILELRELEGLSYEEISDKLGTKIGTVMSRLFHARRKFQTIYKRLSATGINK